jgi:hypothetical protein
MPAKPLSPREKTLLQMAMVANAHVLGLEEVIVRLLLRLNLRDFSAGQFQELVAKAKERSLEELYLKIGDKDPEFADFLMASYLRTKAAANSDAD